MDPKSQLPCTCSEIGSNTKGYDQDGDKLCPVCQGVPNPISKHLDNGGQKDPKRFVVNEDQAVREPTETESSPFIVNKDENFGQCLMASRDLKTGANVLDEIPAFFGPSADLIEDYETPLCLGCCVVMNDGNEGNRCPKCKWPICGPNCDKISYHEENECDLFFSQNVQFPPNVVIQHCYKGVTIVRGLLLKERSPEVWAVLMNLQYKTQLQMSPYPEFEEFKKDLGLPEFGTNEDWARILGILNVNSYSIQRVEKSIKSPSFAEFIYPVQSLMAHSCVPNCTWAVTYSPEFVIKVRPAVDIKKGEMLTVAYNFDFNKYGCYKRQEMIRNLAEFNCRCARCLDPTDLGVNAAALICFKCKTGLVLPIDPVEPESDWKCNECNYKICQSFVVSFVEALYEEVEMAELEAEESEESIFQILEDIISKNSGSALHPNHWVLSEASQLYIKKQCSNVDLTEVELERFLWHCEYLLKIRNVLAPGISSERGILQHYIARALLRKTEFAIKNKALANETEIGQEIRKVYEVQKCALLFWKDNPHYKTLPEDYKRQSKGLIDDIERVKTQYLSGVEDI